MQSDRRDSNARVYVSNLSVAFTEDDLRKQFDKFGPIESVSLKQRDTFSFAFIEYKEQKDAQQAISAMNRKLLDSKQIKVELSRSNGKRDFNSRGGDSRGDRGGFRGRDDRGPRRDFGDRNRDDRAPRRDFGDRPKGCFNCGKDGHFARDCSEPRKPRDFPPRSDRNDRDRDEGYRRRSRSRSGDRHKKSRKRSSSGSSRS